MVKLGYTQQQLDSIEIAKRVLSQYNYYLHMARHKPTLGSPVSDGMPSGSIVGNRQENKLVEYIDDPARRYCDECRRIFDLIEDEESKECAKVLKSTYTRYDKTAVKLAAELDVSTRTIERLKRLGLLIFGESIDEMYMDRLKREYKLSRRLDNGN